MHSLRTLMSELHPTSFINKLSHDNMIEKCSSEHVKKKKKGNKDENCNALVAILLFLVVGHVLFEFINDYVNM